MERKKTNSKIGRMGVSLPTNLLEPFDAIIKEQGYSQRSEAIRDLIRGHIENYVLRKETGNEIRNEIGVICFLIATELREVELTKKIAHCESEHRDIVKSVMPVVLPDKQIFMAVMVNGDVKRILAFENAMRSLKGVVLVGYASWGLKNV